MLNLQFNEALYKSTNGNELTEFLFFLTKYYSDKQILKLFTSSELRDNSYILKDTLNEFFYRSDLIENRFNKVNCKIELLHNEFVRCTKERRYEHMKNETLNYAEDKMKPCITIGEYEVKLPINGKELSEWADMLHNCMAGYFSKIKNDETVIYCFFKKNNPMFAVEIINGILVQATGNHNAELTIHENELLTQWYELFFQEDKQVIVNVA